VTVDAVLQHVSRPDLRQRFLAARADPALAVIEGFHALKHALRFAAQVELAVTDDAAVLRRLAERLAPDLVPAIAALALEIPPDLFAALAPRPTATGVLAVARRPAVDVAALFAAPAARPLVLLQRPSDLGNVGAVVRVAAAAGAAGVVTMGHHDPWHPTALRGGAGLQFALPVARLDTLPPLARPLVALHPDGEPLAGIPLPQDAVLAFGSERRGLDADLLDRADLRMAIPMRPGVSSLNLATAVAIALYVGWPSAGA
jgi:tRNA G18 (ribose-2'-O)-methylase SpoU